MSLHAIRIFEFIKAGYLNDHPKVIDTMYERVGEILEGANNMNCQLCKYREQVLGFEAEIGLPQESHHHHVEGLGDEAECKLCDTICTGACDKKGADAHSHSHGHSHSHDHGHGHHHHHHHGDGHSHDHHHHPYPHADHPHGPKSMLKETS